MVHTVARAHGSCGRLDGLKLTLRAGLDGAVAETVSKVGIFAETFEVIIGAAELLCLFEHVVDTSALRGCVSRHSGNNTQTESDEELTPHSGTLLKSWAQAAAARRKMGAMTFMIMQLTWKLEGEEDDGDGMIEWLE